MLKISEKKRFSALDSWRGVCAILVALFHGQQVIGSHLQNSLLIQNSWLFVDFFFVLSGFVISHAYKTRLSSGGEVLSFIVRRIGRLWPLHLVTLFALIFLELAKLVVASHGLHGDVAPFTEKYSPILILKNIFLVEGLLTRPSWNEPSWSISAEFWTYLIFAGIVWLSIYRGSRSLRGLDRSFAVLLIISGMALYGFKGEMGATSDFGIFRCVMDFISGYFTYRLLEIGFRQAKRFATIVEFLDVLVVGLFVSFAAGTHLEFLAPLIFGFTVWLFAQEAGFLSRLLCRQRPLLLGTLSYSIYLNHYVILQFILRMATFIESRTGVILTSWVSTDGGRIRVIMWHGEFGGDIILAAFTGFTVIVSIFTYRYVEKFGQGLFAGLHSRIFHLKPVNL